MPQKYPKPPILEAVLHVRYGSPMTEGELKRIPHLLESEYPKSKEESEFQLQFRIENGMPSGKPKPEVVDHGARLLSHDDHRLVVIRRSSVLFSYLAPYPGWDRFLVAAQFVFDTLREKLGYKPISSVGLRYVNRLDVPLAENQSQMMTSDYLVTGIAVPENGITNAIRAFQSLVELDIKHDQLIGRVQTASVPPALINHAALLFDIDIIAQQSVPNKTDEFWSLVSRMREDKNAIFESGITDMARRLFGWTQ